MRLSTVLLTLVIATLSGCVSDAPDEEPAAQKAAEPTGTGVFNPDLASVEETPEDIASGTEEESIESDPNQGGTQDPPAAQPPSPPPPGPAPPTAPQELPPPGDVKIQVSGEEDTFSFSYSWNTVATSVTWWFGDGESSRIGSINHQYARVGEYEVILRVEGGGEIREATKTLHVENVPLRVTSNRAGAEVSFAFTWGYDNPTISWDFGDGTSSTESAPTHPYTTGGPFDVVLTVSSGGVTKTNTTTITFTDYPLTLNAIRDRTLVDFTADWGWDFDEIEWDFGDGSEHSTEESPTWGYPAGGTFEVTLRVKHGDIEQFAVASVSVPTYHPRIIVDQLRGTDEVVQLSFDWNGLTPTEIEWIIDGIEDPVTTPTVDVTFPNLGTYDVSLSLIHDGDRGVEIERAAEAAVAVTNMQAEIETTKIGLMVDFKVTWLPAPHTYTTVWNFGDGSATSESKTPRHRYDSDGTYTVTVLLTKTGGTPVRTATLAVDVSGASPIAFADDPTDALVRPGSQTIAGGSGCTSNFLYTYNYERYFIGSAAHCVKIGGEAGGQQHDGCDSMPESLPLGTPVSINNWNNHNTAITAKLAYSSWATMHATGETDDDTCVGNDFALYEIAPNDWGKIHPAVIHYQGPTGSGEGAEAEEDVYGFGASGLRSAFGAIPFPVTSQTSPLSGTYIEASPDGWLHAVQMIPPAIQGDSGSALLSFEGKALGALSTISVGGSNVVSNQYTDIEKALAYMLEKELWAPTVVTWTAFNPDPTPPLVQELLLLLAQLQEDAQDAVDETLASAEETVADTQKTAEDQLTKLIECLLLGDPSACVP